MATAEEAALMKNVKQYVLFYNQLTQKCFSSCVHSMSYAELTSEEDKCVSSCAGKLMQSNHRIVTKATELQMGTVQQPPGGQ